MEDNNTVNISDIINGLKIIKEECTKHSICADCPFYSNGRCNIKYVDPEYWELSSSYIWRAFK